eukprot:gene8167-62681_t
MWKKAAPGQLEGRWTVDFAPEGQVTNAYGGMAHKGTAGKGALKADCLRRELGHVCTDCHRGASALRKFWLECHHLKRSI